MDGSKVRRSSDRSQSRSGRASAKMLLNHLYAIWKFPIYFRISFCNGIAVAKPLAIKDTQGYFFANQPPLLERSRLYGEHNFTHNPDARSALFLAE
jgi:hypothetical protein